MTTLWHRSGTPQFKKGKVELDAGATVEFFKESSTTPLTVYLDKDSTTPAQTANLQTDGDALWPDLYVPYGTFRYRIKEVNGTTVTFTSDILNPAPLDSATVTDTNKLLQTGFMVYVPAKIQLTSFVRANGRTIGNGSSGATERANPDTEALFTYFYDNLADAQAAVSGGRGASAAADFAANKTLALPDIRSGLPWALDDMGNSAAGAFSLGSFSHGDATTGGSRLGDTSTGNQLILSTSQLPSHAHGVGTFIVSTVADHNHAITDPSHDHVIPQGGANILIQSGSTFLPTAGAGAQQPSLNTYTQVHGNNVQSAATGISLGAAGGHNHSLSGDSASVGSGSAANIAPKGVLGTWLIKL